MNALKGLYIWTLTTLLILAGCLGGGVIDEGEGESTEDGGTTTLTNTDSVIFSAGGTSVVNAYENNKPVCNEMYGASKSTWNHASVDSEYLCEFTVHSINTQAGEMLTFIGYHWENIRVTSNCSGVINEHLVVTGIAMGNGAMECEYTLTHHVNVNLGYSALWSTAYTITQTTVV